jgi:hypothetical protein
MKRIPSGRGAKLGTHSCSSNIRSSGSGFLRYARVVIEGPFQYSQKDPAIQL